MDEPRFPTESVPVDDVLAEIRARRDRDADWRGGRTFSLVYHPDDEEIDRLHEAVAIEYLHENALNPFAFPSLTEMEAEVIATPTASSTTSRPSPRLPGRPGRCSTSTPASGASCSRFGNGWARTWRPGTSGSTA